MSRQLSVKLELPDDLASLRFPRHLDQRLQHLLDRQDQGETLAPEERIEAEELVNFAEMLSLLRARAEAALRDGADAT
jgi:hypothetical protein